MDISNYPVKTIANSALPSAKLVVIMRINAKLAQSDIFMKIKNVYHVPCLVRHAQARIVASRVSPHFTLKTTNANVKF
jgi:hypothetical protein